MLTAMTMAYLFVIIAINLLPLIGPFLVPLALLVHDGPDAIRDGSIGFNWCAWAACTCSARY